MRMQVHLRKPEPWVLPTTLVCLALGALIASMLRAATATPEAAVDLNKLRPEQLVRLYSQAKGENEKLQAELLALQNDKTRLVDSITKDLQLREALQREMNQLRISAGVTPVQGPGIVITIDDSKAAQPTVADVNPDALITHDLDLLLLVNELRSAGAEAIAVNGQRVVSTTAVRCVGPVIQVNSQPISAPFVVSAIGKQDVLSGAVNMPFGVLEQLKPLDIKVTVEKKDSLRIPAVRIVPRLEVGTAVTESTAPAPPR